MINAMRAWIQKRKARINDRPHPIQGLIDADNKSFPAAHYVPRDCYRKLSEVPQGVNHG